MTDLSHIICFKNEDKFFDVFCLNEVDVENHLVQFNLKLIEILERNPH